MQIAHNVFVAVADGRKMLLFRNEGDAVHPNLELVTGEEQINPADRDQKSDAPGRGFSSMGNRRSAYDEVDFHQLGEDRFASKTADFLKSGALNGDYEALLIVAPPTTLGMLRKHYHVEVERRLVGEIAKDLTGHPVDEIERVIAQS